MVSGTEFAKSEIKNLIGSPKLNSLATSMNEAVMLE